MRRAEDSARKALALDPTLDEAHTVLGAALYFGRHDYRGALESFARGVEFNPRRPTQQRLLADLLCLYGRFDEALAELRRGQELEPLEPDMIVHEALVHYWRRHWPDAERVANRSIAGKPDYWYGHWVLGLVMQQQGKLEEAGQELERSRAAVNSGLRPIIALGHLWGATGQREKAAGAIAEVRAAAQGNLRRYIYPEAMIRAAMGAARCRSEFATPPTALHPTMDANGGFS